MAGLLIGGDLTALATGLDANWAGRVGLALVFLFTSLGHFLKTGAMVEMLPPAIPARRTWVAASGVLEGILAVALLVPLSARAAGFAIGCFLLAVTPVNISAALRRADFGGHAAGPKYLWVRLPMQLLLLIWAFWFATHTPPS